MKDAKNKLKKKLVSSFFLIYAKSSFFHTLMLFDGWQEGHLNCKKLGFGILTGALYMLDFQLALPPCLPSLIAVNAEWFYSLVPAYPSYPGIEAVKRECVN